MKKVLSLALAVLLCFGTGVTAFASSVGLAEGVTEEMCEASYWKERTFTDADEVLMTADDIAAYNAAAVAGSGTYVVGIENIKATYNANYQRSVIGVKVPTRKLYIDGELIDNTEYYGKINDAITNTGYTETSKETEYGIVVRQTDMKSIPTLDTIGYSATDADDEMEYENMTVNEPFAVRGMCIIDGQKFFYGWSTDCCGWVNADNIAICSSREEWLSAWKNDLNGDDFIVITQDRVTLEPSLRDKDLDGLKLLLGTSLKLIPEDEMPATIDGRNNWNNYAVYIPIRNDDGSYSKKAALIPQKASVSVGYLPFTQANLLDVAFTCLGNRYGWAGMLDSYDCSLYTRTVYRCFGLTYPRNGTWQKNVPNCTIDLTGMTDDEKLEFISTLPTCSTLYFSGHTMFWLGMENGVGYALSDLGTVVESEGSTDVLTVYNVAITPLTVRRGASYNYTTWLHNISSATMVMPKRDISNCEVSVDRDCTSGEDTITVTEGGKALYENINYTVSYDDDGNVVITGINNYEGTTTATPVTHIDSDGDGYCDKCGENISGKKCIDIINFFKKIIAWFKALFSITIL